MARILQEIGADNLLEANRCVELLNLRSSDPDVCNQETLAALQHARNLAIAQRAHLLVSLRSLKASRLYRVPAELNPSTWHIDG